jgi:hypothetical protein
MIGTSVFNPNYSLQKMDFRMKHALKVLLRQDKITKLFVGKIGFFKKILTIQLS